MKLAITSLYHHLLTGIILLDENFVIIDINTALEQMLSTSRVQILQTQIFDILLPKISDETLSQAIGTQTIAKGIESQSLAFNQTLTQQFEHCRQLHQSFIYYNSLIHGVHSPLLVDYGVTPIEDSRGFFYVIELWTKDRQSRIEQEQQQHAQRRTVDVGRFLQIHHAFGIRVEFFVSLTKLLMLGKVEPAFDRDRQLAAICGDFRRHCHGGAPVSGFGLTRKL